MLRLDENIFETNTIIDLVVLPGMPVSAIISRLTEEVGHMIVLDTQGDLHLEYGSMPWIDREGGQSSQTASTPVSAAQRIDYCFTVSLSDLFSKLDDVKKHRDFVLVIDSATFVCDRSPDSIRPFNAALWSIVYKCNATVITVNHYRVGRVHGAHKLIPRMGSFWSHTVSYQLQFRYGSCGIEFTASSRPPSDF